MRKINRQGLLDMASGGIVLGSGGGGDVRISKQLAEDALKINSEIRMVDTSEVPDDAIVAVVSGMGSPVATKKKGFDPEQWVSAIDILEEVSGKKISYTVAIETGGGNFMPPVYVAVRKELAFIDGDGVGRAIPEMQMTMYEVNKVPASPFVMADADGTSAVLYVKDALKCERLGRAVATEMGGVAGVANYLMTGRIMKKAVVPGTYTRAERVGRALRAAISLGDDPVRAVLEATGGVELIRGRLDELVSNTVKSHDVGYQIITGEGKYEGYDLKIAFKNENIIAWDGRGRPRVVSPDLITVMGCGGELLTNADLEEGMTVAAIAVQCNPRWRTPEGTGIFKEVLAEMGYDGDYIPVEVLCSEMR